jgi:hypothetical protein
VDPKSRAPSTHAGPADDPAPSTHAGRADDPAPSTHAGRADDPAPSTHAGPADDPAPSTHAGPADDPAPSRVEVLKGGHPIGPRYREAFVMLNKADLQRIVASLGDDSDDAPEPRPTTIEEFRSILQRVDEFGWRWSTDDPPGLTPKDDSSDPSSIPQALGELATQYPQFPGELAAIIKFALWGWKPPVRVVGPPIDWQGKADAASEYLLTNNYRSEFFFDYSTKIRRFWDLDWEIMVKAAERNIATSPGTVYATISLETAEKQPDLDDALDTVSFAADGKSLRLMIKVLNDALNALEETTSRVQYLRREAEKGKGKTDAEQ